MHQRRGLGPNDKYTAFGYDLDNTLLYSEKVNEYATRGTCKAWGFKYPKLDKQDVVGLANRDLFRLILSRQAFYIPSHIRRNAIVVNKMVAMKRQLFSDKIYESTPVPGAVELVRALYKLGFPRGIATVAGKQSLGVSLARLGLSPEMFTVLVPGDSLPRGKKPKPDPFHWRHTAELLCEDTSRVLIVEDSEKGISSARGAGLDVVALSTTCTESELRAMGVLEVFKDHFELAHWLGVEIEKKEE